jgi:hypothetical protein
MVPSCSRGGLEWTWARGIASRRAEPVRPLKSSGVRTDMTTRVTKDNSKPEPRSGSQDGCAGRKFRSWGGRERDARKSHGNDARTRLHQPLSDFGAFTEVANRRRPTDGQRIEERSFGFVPSPDGLS